MTRSISHPLRHTLLGLCLLAGGASSAFAQRDLAAVPDPDPELERQALQVAEGFEINLYAADPLLAKPIQMNFDPAGRLWVASSEVYPQIKPGQVANDKILVLDDTDGDGRADKTTVFADGLLIPTGVLPGDGGVYVANSTELLHLKDTDGDGQADQRKVILSGFGTEDTHHLLHTLRWGPEGLMYMNQSIYIHSHIETPYGVRRMNGGGIWAFRPETLQLETFMLGLVNSWGHQFDRFGQSFATDGAGGEGINYIFPGWVGVTSPGAPRVMHGLNPGSPKHCGLTIASGRHLPDDWQGNCLTNDFRAHRVCRFTLTEDGSGFASKQEVEVVKSQHVAFRPIDVAIGPDGAIYIADWYNPIIQHGEVDFRDPRRDHVHGRIWRVTAKDRPLAPRPQLVGQPVAALLEALKSAEDFTRHGAKRVLKERGAAAVLPELAAWTATLDAQDAQFEQQRLEALWTYQSLDVVEPNLLRGLLTAQDHRVRAAATRVVYHWHARLQNPLDLLAARVTDEHPRVRLEAVRALSQIADPRACVVAMRALDHPVDKNLDFALWMTARDLKAIWLPALERGEINFGGDVAHLTFALKSADAPGVVPLVMRQLQSGTLNGDQQRGTLETVALLASPDELRAVFELARQANTAPALKAEILKALSQASARRKVAPAGDLSPLGELLASDESTVQAAALRLVGAWKVQPLAGRVVEFASLDATPPSVRQAAIESLSQLGGAAEQQALMKLAREATPAVRMQAVSGLAASNLDQAAQLAVSVLTSLPANEDPRPMIETFLARQEGPAALGKALAGQKLPPDIGKLVLRTVRSSGSPHEELVAAIGSAAGLNTGPVKLSPAETAALLADVAQQGDPAQGESIYRREEQACLKCHAIGGAGGQVGPDLVSIGASAQLDYLLEAVLDPGAKIKENYHSQIVMTDAGQVVTGVKIRETDSELILRDAEDRELRVPLDEIVAAKDGGSMMPSGLTDSLTRAELVDLIRFLSELGKVGPYAVGNQPVVRRWQTPETLDENRRRLESGAAAAVSDPQVQWRSAYSQVNGSLPVAELPTFAAGAKGELQLARFEVEVTTPGAVRLQVNSPEGLTFWLDQQSEPSAVDRPLELTAGRHQITVAIDPQARQAPLVVQLAESPGSSARAQLVSGK